jgi:hypothetical protein
MSFVILDRVRETTQTTGTGSVVLRGALSGYKPFSSIGDGNSTYYVIVLNAQWEAGIGTYSASTNTLSRDEVLSSSNNNNLVNFANGTKDILLSQSAERAVYVDGTTLVASNNAILPIASGGTGNTTGAASNVTGTVAVANGGTGQTTYTNGQLLIGNTTGNTLAKATLTAGTGVSITNGAGAITVTNSAPDQTVALTGAGSTSISGTYPNFTITGVAYSLATSTSPGLIELASDTAQSVAANAVTATASRTYGLQLNAAGQGVVNVPWIDTTYSLATSTTLGLIELGSDTQQTVAPNAVSSTASRSYALQVNAAGQGVVNVPWTDTNSGGTVTSVAISGGTTGLTTSGGPITTSGTVTLAGTLAVANGGTGTSTPSLVAGTNVTISGSWPNQTVNASGGGGTLIGVTQTFPTGELTALGFSAGASSSGLGTTFIGYNAGRVNSSGYDNTALGTNAMWANTSGFKNTAIGAGALFANTNGDNNIAIGNALFQSPGGDNNIAIGDLALRSTSGNSVYSCVAIGTSALRDNTTGMDNTAIGHFAGYLNGVNSNTTGNNNTFVGNGAVGASQTASNAITLGNSSITTLRCQVTTITSLSDARDKTNIMDIPAGLSFVQALRPVAFDWNMRDGGKIGVREFGFIAQELQAAQTQTGITVPNLLYTDNPEKLEASAGTLMPVLVKAIQELKTQLDAVKSEIALLRT